MSRRCVTLLAALWLALPLAARAQTVGAAPRSATGNCYGFAFGAWSPPLDLRAAGHASLPAGGTGPAAPGGRDWAAPSDSSNGGAMLLLFPGWWPAGVNVELPGGPPGVGDTVRGVARALVADGRLRPPTSRVRAWGVPCGRGVGVESGNGSGNLPLPTPAPTRSNRAPR